MIFNKKTFKSYNKKPESVAEKRASRSGDRTHTFIFLAKAISQLLLRQYHTTDLKTEYVNSPPSLLTFTYVQFFSFHWSSDQAPMGGLPCIQGTTSVKGD